MIKKYFVALKHCQFDKPYAPGDEIPAEVIDSSAVARLIDGGYIQEATAFRDMEDIKRVEELLIGFEERILAKVDERIAAAMEAVPVGELVVLDTTEDENVPGSDTAAESEQVEITEPPVGGGSAIPPTDVPKKKK